MRQFCLVMYVIVFKHFQDLGDAMKPTALGLRMAMLQRLNN